MKEGRLDFEVTTLDKISVNSCARITKILSKDLSFVSRLNALGIVVGNEATVLHIQPFGGPLSIRISGAVLSLRQSEADAIEVEF